MLSASILIKNGIVLTEDQNDTVYKDGAVTIKEGRIEAVGKTEEVAKGFKADEVIDAKGHAVLPGFVNLHCHSGLIRSTAEDLPLWEWLRKHVDPKHRVLTPEDAYIASKLCYIEMIKAGITNVLDMYRFMHRCAEAAIEVGIRATMAPFVADQPEYLGAGVIWETLDDNVRLIEKFNGAANDRIHIWVGLEHLVYTVPETFVKAREISDKHGVGIHTHGEESREMAEKLTQQYRMRPTRVFYERGILGPKTVLAHCVWLTDEEVELIAKTHTNVAHCPVSNMKLASGVARIPELLGKGVKVGLGSDGIKENNRIDIIQEMKFAGLIQKGFHRNASLMPANVLLRMATTYGSEALGLGPVTGSLEKGKKADVILINLKTPHTTPVLTGEFYNVPYHLVYSSQAADVDTTIVDGKIIMRNRKVLTVDEEDVIETATIATKDLLERRKPFVPKD